MIALHDSMLAAVYRFGPPSPTHFLYAAWLAVYQGVHCMYGWHADLVKKGVIYIYIHLYAYVYVYVYVHVYVHV